MIDLRRKVQPTPELQKAVDKRRETLSQILSDIKQGKIPKSKVIRG
jgi:hypothetical protein